MTRHPRRHGIASWPCAILCGLWFFGAAAHAAPPGKPLVLGLTPNLSPRSMLAVYQPLRQGLELRLARPVALYTAPDFRQFYLRSVAGEYDLVLMPAHFARLAQIEAGLVPIAKFTPMQEGVVLVAKNSHIKREGDLQGKRIVLVDNLALVTLQAEDWLRVRGLTQGGNAFTHHNAAVEAVINGHADAAIVASAPFASMPRDMREAVRVLGTMGKLPSNVFVANPRLSREEIRRLQEALLDFAQHSDAGRAFLARYHYQAIVPLAANELKAMDNYAERVKQIMRAQEWTGS